MGDVGVSFLLFYWPLGEAMTPTQAQIEAAAKALEAYDLASGPTANYKEMATAALTAAAQVGEKGFDMPTRDEWREYDQAGADPAESVESQLSTAIENVRAETIERCAQVAAEFTKHAEIYNGDTIAAAIRALKD